MPIIDFVGSVLRVDATVLALVPALNISAGLRPQEFDTLPAVNYFEIGAETFDRSMASRHDVQISARAVELRDAVVLSEACGRALYKFDPQSAESVDVQHVQIGSRVSLPEPDIDAFHVALTISFSVLSTVV